MTTEPIAGSQGQVLNQIPLTTGIIDGPLNTSHPTKDKASGLPEVQMTQE